MSVLTTYIPKNDGAPRQFSKLLRRSAKEKNAGEVVLHGLHGSDPLYDIMYTGLLKYKNSHFTVSPIFYKSIAPIFSKVRSLKIHRNGQLQECIRMDN